MMRSLILSALLFFLPFSAMAGAPLCSEVFQITHETPWGTLRSDFKHNTKYSVELQQGTSIKNQCNLGTCHLHSWLSHLERSYEMKSGEVLTLSNQYVSAKHWLQRSMQRLASPDKKFEVSLGAGPLVSRESLLQYGLIPEGVWQPKADFMVNPQAKVMNQYLENIIVRTKWQAEKSLDSAGKEAALNQGREQIRNLFRQMVGEIPENFMWRGKSWTPRDFAQSYFASFEGPTLQMIVNNNRKSTPQYKSTKQGSQLAVNLETLESTTRALLDKGEAVYLAYDHHAEYVDAATGIISIRAFHIPSYARPPTRQMRESFEANSGGHAVQIVGYEVDPRTNRVIKWKIRNSWGNKKGDEGFYHMYDDYFRAFAKSVTFPEVLLNEVMAP